MRMFLILSLGVSGKKYGKRKYQDKKPDYDGDYRLLWRFFWCS